MGLAAMAGRRTSHQLCASIGSSSGMTNNAKQLILTSTFKQNRATVRGGTFNEYRHRQQGLFVRRKFMFSDHALYIRSVIDKALLFSDENFGLQYPFYSIPENMIDRSKDSPYPDIVFWKALPANISTERINEYERKIGFPLPNTYKDFLSHKYFIEINFGHEAEFFSHTTSWVENFYDEILRIGLEETLKMGLIPFARETDRGYFCFDTNEVHEGSEYKLVDYYREFGASPYPSIRHGQFTFIDLVRELDERLEQWKLAKQTSA